MNAEDKERFDRAKRQWSGHTFSADEPMPEVPWLCAKLDEVQSELAKVKEQQDKLADALMEVLSEFGGTLGRYANGPFELGIISICRNALAQEKA